MASIEEMYGQLTNETHTHVPKLVAAGYLWRDARAWIDGQATLLHQQANQLVTQDRWPDAAGRQFMARVTRDIAVMRSWTDPSGMVNSMMTVGLPLPQKQTTASEVLDKVNDLNLALWAALNTAKDQVDHYNRLSEEDRGKQRQEIETKIADEITKLGPKFQDTALAMKKAVGSPWEGPLAATSGQGNPGPATNGVPASGAASPSASPAPSSPQPTDPAPTEEEAPETTDPVKDALEAAPGALDALSQAMQSAQQLMGGGTESPSPTPLSPIDPLGPGNSLTPAEVADRLARLDGGSGLPSLAGGGVSPVGGPAGAAGGTPSPTAPTNPASPGGVGNAAFPAVASLSATGSGGTGAAGTPGAMPPAQQQPQHGGARTGNGIKPGAAEHAATGRSRDRKSGATPGVSLLGRSGRGRPVNRAGEPAPAPRRWDRENDTVQLLDEELWQVNQEDSGPRYRAGQ